MSLAESIKLAGLTRSLKSENQVRLAKLSRSTMLTRCVLGTVGMAYSADIMLRPKDNKKLEKFNQKLREHEACRAQ